MGQKSHMQEGFNKGAWTTLEDQILKDYIGKYGEGKWNTIPKKTGLKRCGKSCRLRWLNYLRPGIKRGHISRQEEDLIIRLQRLLGNRWSLIAGRLPGRTDNEIKNYWNTTLKKKLQKRQYPSPSEDGKMKTTEETRHDETPSLDNSQLCGSKDEQPLISTSGHGEMDWKWMDELSPVTCSNCNFGDLAMDGFDECSFDFSPFSFPEISFDQI